MKTTPESIVQWLNTFTSEEVDWEKDRDAQLTTKLEEYGDSVRESERNKCLVFHHEALEEACELEEVAQYLKHNSKENWLHYLGNRVEQIIIDKHGLCWRTAYNEVKTLTPTKEL